MKHNKSFIAAVFFSLLSFTQVSAANSNEVPTALPVELKYAGNVKNLPLIQLDFSGTREENEFYISITDESGFVLYSDKVKGEKFSKQFLLNTEDLGFAVLNFEIKSARSGKTVVYKVSPREKITPQVSIVKL